MNWTRVIGFGILIWVLMFAIVSAFMDLYEGTVWMKIVMAVVAGAIALILAGYVKPKDAGMALACGATWVVIGLVLDYVVTVRQFDAEIFNQWSVWLGYLLILLAPLLKVNK